MTVCAEKLFPGGKIGDEGVGKGEKRGSDRGCGKEARRAAEAPGVLELERVALHAAVTSGGERSWISSAVSRSMTIIGPPHLGQE